MNDVHLAKEKKESKNSIEQNEDLIEKIFAVFKHWWFYTLIGIIVFSFILDLAVLSMYELSYGPDGPYYDLQVREILRTGFPDSNDPPLIYYYLSIFVLLLGDSFLGIKVGMAFICSLMAIPAFLLTETISDKFEFNSHIPSLLAAFLITINIYSFRMIEDFMQNLFGNFFVLWLLYFSIRWFEDIKKWKIFGTLTVLCLMSSILSHIFSGAVAMVLFAGMFLFSTVIKTIKSRKLPFFELGILVLFLGIIGVGLLISIFLFPSIYSNFQIRLSSYLGSLSLNSDSETNSVFATSFLSVITIPFILGIVPTSITLFKELKSKVNESKKPIINKKTFLSFLYILLTVLFLFLVIFPSDWQERFVLLASMPISLIVPVGLIFLEKPLSKIFSQKLRKKNLLIGGIAILLASASLIRVVQLIPHMGPVITDEQYDELVEIRDNNIPNQIDPNGIVKVQSVIGFGYWVKYVLDMEISGNDNITDLANDNEGKAIYGIFEIQFVDSPFQSTHNYPWNPILPYREPSGNDLEIVLQDDKPEDSIPEGKSIYRGSYLEMRVFYYSNGTRAIEEEKPNVSQSNQISALVIDDSGGGDYTWTTASSEAWCSGSGTASDPYVIEDIIIEWSSEKCFTIKNSKKYFTLKNCEIINSGTSPDEAGLILNGVSNGQIFKCEIKKNSMGLMLDNCDAVVIKDNIVSDNEFDGIFIKESSSITMENNQIRGNGMDGIRLLESDNNILKQNTIDNNNNLGIYLEKSNDNNVENNIVSSEGDCIKEIDSTENTFENNTCQESSDSENDDNNPVDQEDSKSDQQQPEFFSSDGPIGWIYTFIMIAYVILLIFATVLIIKKKKISPN